MLSGAYEGCIGLEFNLFVARLLFSFLNFAYKDSFGIIFLMFSFLYWIENVIIDHFWNSKGYKTFMQN